MRIRIIIYLCLPAVMIVLLAACGSNGPVPRETTAQPAVLASLTPSPRLSPTPEPTSTITLTPSLTPLPTQTYTPTPDTRPDPQLWGGWPIVPTVSGVAQEID